LYPVEGDGEAVLADARAKTDSRVIFWVDMMRNRTDSTFNAQGKYFSLLIRTVIIGRGVELAGLDHHWEALKSRRGVYTLKRAWNRSVFMAS